jgi:hypothetical protein
MDPMFAESVEVEAPPRRPVLPQLWSASRALLSALVTLLTVPLSTRSRAEDDETTGRVAGLLRRVIYWTALVPAGLIVVVLALCHIATHPRPPDVALDPGSLGVFYDAVTVAVSETRRLDAWLVQPMDARRVLDERELALRRRFPAVVLLHDHASGPHQMLPLVKPLRDAGFVVLVLRTDRLSGGETSESSLGVREAQDVLAAVRLLQRQTFVDPQRLAVVGAGTGGNAAALSATLDPIIRCVVLDGPLVNAEQALARHVMPSNESLSFLTPFCRWVLQAVHGIDLEGLDIGRALRELDGRPVLVFQSGEGQHIPGDGRARQIVSFLGLHLDKSRAQTVSSTSAMR